MEQYCGVCWRYFFSLFVFYLCILHSACFHHHFSLQRWHPRPNRIFVSPHLSLEILKDPHLFFSIVFVRSTTLGLDIPPKIQPWSCCGCIADDIKICWQGKNYPKRSWQQKIIKTSHCHLAKRSHNPHISPLPGTRHQIFSCHCSHPAVKWSLRVPDVLHKETMASKVLREKSLHWRCPLFCQKWDTNTPEFEGNWLIRFWASRSHPDLPKDFIQLASFFAEKVKNSISHWNYQGLWREQRMTARSSNELRVMVISRSAQGWWLMCHMCFRTSQLLSKALILIGYPPHVPG